jgi:hypothetical protein
MRNARELEPKGDSIQQPTDAELGAGADPEHNDWDSPQIATIGVPNCQAISMFSLLQMSQATTCKVKNTLQLPAMEQIPSKRRIKTKPRNIRLQPVRKIDAVHSVAA